MALLLDAAAMLTVRASLLRPQIEVKMVNKGSDGGVMVFEPTQVKIEPGDTVNFVARDTIPRASRAYRRTARLPSSARMAKT